MIVETKDLNTAYEAYKSGKIMRQDLFRVICDNVIALQGIVADLKANESQVSAARDELADIRQQFAGLDTRIEAKVALAVNAAVSMVQAMNGAGPASDRVKPRNRPSRQTSGGSVEAAEAL